MAAIEQSIEIGADISLVQAVISDFEHYPAFVPHVEATEVMRAADSDASRLRVAFTVSLIRRIHYTLDVKIMADQGLNIQGQSAQGLNWSLVEGPFEHNVGGWRLESLGPHRTRATYFIDAALRAPIPRLVEKRLIAQSLPETLRAFRDEAERREAARRSQL